MSEDNPIRIFVTHTFSDNADYARVFEYLESSSNFFYKNCSVPNRTPASGGTEALKEELREELRSIFNVRPDLRLVLLADGAEDNWEFLDALAAEVGATEYYSAVDLFHVLEHIKKACDAYYGEGSPDSKSWFEQARVWLREFDDGAERVIRSLRYRRDRSTGTKRKTIAAQIRYMEKRRHQMRYYSLLQKNLPVGSGVVEAACKTLASERMKRSGMSWMNEGGQAILTLRSLIQSDRFDRAWSWSMWMLAPRNHASLPVQLR